MAPKVIDREQFVRDWFAEWAPETPVFGWASDLLFDAVTDDPETAWDLVVRLVAGAPDGDALGWVAAGPLEDILCEHGADFIDRVEALAGSDERFRRCLGGVQGENRMEPEVYARVRRALGRETS
jgi:hypothetical protein